MPGREWVWVSYDHYVVITGMVGDDFVINDPIGLDGHGERVLTAAQMDAHNSFDHPEAVTPQPFAGHSTGDRLVLDLPAKSVAVVEIQ